MPLEFLSAEVGGRQVRAGLVRFLSPSTLGGWAGFLTSLGRPGLTLRNIQEPQAICPGLCVPCQQCQAVFQCQPHLCSRISSQLSENSHARAHLSPVQAIDSPAETWVGRHCCQSSASVCKFLKVVYPLSSVVLILTLPGCAALLAPGYMGEACSNREGWPLALGHTARERRLRVDT